MDRSLTTVGLTLTAMDAALDAVIPAGVPAWAIPVIQMIHGFASKLNGRPVSNQRLIAKILLAIGALHGTTVLYNFAKPLFLPLVTSSITVPFEHQVGQQVRKWLANRGSSNGSSLRHARYTMDYNGGLTGGKTSALQNTWLIYNGRPIFMSQTKVNEGKAGSVGRNDSSHISGDELTITTIGSAVTLDKLVQQAVLFDRTEDSVTWQFHMIEEYGEARWTARARMTRPMDTIELDPAFRKELMDDIQQFLGRQKYYASRGIPYKRGYLIFGPPGTGKSSFAFACAGFIGASIYRVGLSQISGEKMMMKAFAKIKKKGSVILLEDIDSAGVKREVMKDSAGVKREVMKSKTKDDDEKASGANISLSGLLNAIDDLNDGVILMMTSNSPESLDKALIRPGRVDRQIFLGYISPAIAESMFKRIHKDDEAEAVSPELIQLAKEFAGKIPDGKLTPAEVQGFLLQHSAEASVSEADQWVADFLKAKATGSNVVGVEASDEALGI